MPETALSRSLAAVERRCATLFARALDGEEIGGEAALRVATARGFELGVVAEVADELRRRQAGDLVTYVVNRNINFTNVCIKHCTFCAFSRDHRAEQGYLLPISEVVRRAREAWDFGATEVCIQAGLPPKMDGWLYVDVCKAIKKELPEIHIHAFSPEEVLYGSVRAGVTIPAYLKALKEAGLDTLPGTSAEILVQEIRDRIAPGRITRDQWIEVITSAHELGIRTTSTIMFGHIERPEHWIEHLTLLRDLQQQTGGFTEFVPLSFIHQEAPMTFRHLVPEARRGADAARGRRHACIGSHHARRELPQRTDVLGEGRSSLLRLPARRRMQRRRWNAHQRKHLHLGGSELRATAVPAAVARAHPRHGACRRRALDAILHSEAVRRRRRSGDGARPRHGFGCGVRLLSTARRIRRVPLRAPGVSARRRRELILDRFEAAPARPSPRVFAWHATRSDASLR